MIRFSCTCKDCIHNDQDGDCNSDWVTISNDTLTGGGFLPICEDYQEREDGEEDE